MIYTVLIIWIIYSILEGKREGQFWHHKIKSQDYEIFKSVDRHPMFVLQRASVLLLGGLLSYYITDNFWWTLYIVSMNALLFSFFHNGVMYLERYKMSKLVNPDTPAKWIYPKKWWSQSTTSTAKLTFLMTPLSRSIQALVGIIGYGIYPFL